MKAQVLSAVAAMLALGAILSVVASDKHLSSAFAALIVSGALLLLAKNLRKS